MTQTPSTAVGPTVRARMRSIRWVALALVVIVAVATLTTYLTAARPGGRLDARSTGPEGTHALIALLRDQGIEVVVADTVADVERAAGPDTLIVAAQTFHLYDDDQLARLARLPGDRLVLEPIGTTREQLAPLLRRTESVQFGGLSPGCDLREAVRAGTVQFGAADSYEASEDTSVTRCYDGVLARYRAGGRTVTVVGSAAFVMNSALLEEGNAALALNLAGTQPRMIWYAPQRGEGTESRGDASVFDLIPPQVTWLVWQLVVAVGLLALWRGRRLGPLVAEQLPVVVRASETVEGRGRLYRSRRARDRAAEALRTATLQRMLPRLGLQTGAAPAAVAAAVAQRCGGDPQMLTHTLYGPAPDTDTDLVNLARALDDIERQVAQS
ncbi:hypothetical protein CRI77_05850 [Mycolicibacterium duvalii]|uniref:Membrane protein n=1 Tax=Mycolicibacterium duvalii TaxID=39688 RepID=A0A7I7K7A7_9MYCO|nr:DUF4350 domain-containing protein [Mycolicibacterium duvalii]MCV7368249.1 DUF4350 domain-containing protein [Mycolicibacterium duvalii]PEG43281.1 hypothetical protein CRI77_05850 [Mycolicibacterium duvalii]BBX19907.1 membrane protein [Mycolicibacterium duvalii]